MEVVVETYQANPQDKKSQIRVRPVGGQGISITTNVEICTKIREQFEIGQYFIIPLKWKHPKNLAPCLYLSYKHNKQITPVSVSEAEIYMLKNHNMRLSKNTGNC